MNVINEIKRRYRVPAGLSDHSGNKNTLLAATALGAELIEFHVTFDKNSYGPDSKSSIVVSDVKELIESMNYIQKCINNPVDKSSNHFNKKVKRIFSKTLAVNKDLFKGHKLMIDDLETKKPGNLGVSAENYRKVLGKKLKRDLKRNSFLKSSDLI